MSNTLQEAIDAVRAGDTERAQLVTADFIRENPDNPNGWYLLSQLVDSDARRATYLGKTLALDPNHPRARIEFDALPPAMAADLAPAPSAAAGSEWLDQPVAGGVSEMSPVTEAGAAGTPAWDAPTGTDLRIDERPEDLPEWLQPLSPEPVAAAAEPAPVPAQPRPKPAAPPKKAAPATKNSGNQALVILLGLLALLTVVVLVFLLYLLFF